MNKILLIKHDKIGDFILTWPALYLLRKAIQEATIDIFVNPTVKSLAEACPYIDNVIVDSGEDNAITNEFAAQQYDAAIVLLSDYRSYKLLRGSQIPFMLAPKHNWYQYLYKNRANNKHSNDEGCWRGSSLLVESFLTKLNYSIPPLPKQLWDLNDNKDKWQEFYGKKGSEKLIFVHPGTGGSSGRVSEDNLANLITQIDHMTKVKCHFILTYNGDELKLAKRIKSTLEFTSVKVSIAIPLNSLADFAKSLVAADIFIAGSTGPLHIAGLHNVPTVGFYAGRRSKAHIRWQTLSENDRRFAYTPPVGKKTGRDMTLIDFNQVAQDVAKYLNDQL